ncbi:hypothetical protein COO60DRAFT_1524008 [Scenedesmus sp. NREL 46B-D3]|nr:hypothetical protein COO60DRAFT_1524008 [Scenedesmus sp. NREL 46B-D3]
MPNNNIYDYGGPLVAWSGDDAQPDWAALFPIPASRRIEDRPQQRRSPAQQAAEDGSDEDEDFWLSPRMAYRLHTAGCLYVDSRCRPHAELAIAEMPPVVQPCARRRPWMEAYTQAAMRLVARLERGLEPQPNCTAEECALHKIIEMAEAFFRDGVDRQTGALDALPRSTLDEDFELVSDAAFLDNDVLMLFDMPQLADPSGLTEMMGTANLHPDDWFKPFKREHTSNHV